MKYTFQFQGGDKQILESRSGESQRHIILKVLAYVLYFDRKPRIEMRVTNDKRAYKPDLVTFDEEGNITLWIDCGHITLKKVDDLTKRLREAEFVVIKPNPYELEGYARELMRKVTRPEHARLLAFDTDFVPTLVAAMGHINIITWEQRDSQLCLTFNGQEYATTLWTWSGSQIVPL